MAAERDLMLPAGEGAAMTASRQCGGRSKRVEERVATRST